MAPSKRLDSRTWKLVGAFTAVWLLPLALDLCFVIGWERLELSALMRTIAGHQLAVAAGVALLLAGIFHPLRDRSFLQLLATAAIVSTVTWSATHATQAWLASELDANLLTFFASVLAVGIVLRVLLARFPRLQIVTWAGPFAWIALLALRFDAPPPAALHRPASPNAAHSAAGAPNVVLFVIDTLRADHSIADASSAWHREAGATDLTVYTQAWSPAAGTAPSVKSMLTGLPPSSWGRSAISKPPPPGVSTLALDFEARGYRTGGVTANSLINGGGFSAGHQDYLALGGFDTLKHSLLLMDLVCGGKTMAALAFAERRSLHKVDGQRVREFATEWLGGIGDDPFYLYLHIVDPHWPYREADGSATGGLSHVDLLNRRTQDPLPDPTALAAMEARYRGEVEHAHAIYRAFLDDLEALGLRENTLVIVVGDHGEEFLEHRGFSHGHDAYQEQVHVPLLVHWPRGRALAGPTVDAPFPAAALREIVRSVIDGVAMPAPTTVVSESYPSGRTRSMWRQKDIAVRIEYDGSESPEFSEDVEVYNLATDPMQLRPLAELDNAMLVLIENARAELQRRWTPDRNMPTAPSVEPAGVAGLRELGYTDD
jgi:hypothetical protein